MSFELKILGSASALPTSDRFPSAQLLNVNERFFLIDCGEGTQIQLRRFKSKLLRINNIFISHLHGDHFIGLFGYISTLNLLGRNTELNIYCPKELHEIINKNSEIFGKLQFKINFIYHKNISPNKIYDDKNVEVFSFELKHSVPTWGFLFREKQKQPNIKKETIKKYSPTIEQINNLKNGKDIIINGRTLKNSDLTTPAKPPKSYAYCSDTMYFEDIIDIIKNADLLYHETTFTKDLSAKAKDRMHSTAEQAAIIAKKANVKKLIIGHFSARYKNIDVLENEAKTIFKNTKAVNDGNVFTI